MEPKYLKGLMFVLGTALTGAAMVPAFAPASVYLVGIGGLLVGWSGLRRPGDKVAP